MIGSDGGKTRRSRRIALRPRDGSVWGSEEASSARVSCAELIQSFCVHPVAVSFASPADGADGLLLHVAVIESDESEAQDLVDDIVWMIERKTELDAPVDDDDLPDFELTRLRVVVEA